MSGQGVRKGSKNHGKMLKRHRSQPPADAFGTTDISKKLITKG